MKKDDELLSFKDLSLDEKEFIYRYRTDTIFRACVDKVIYDRLGVQAFDEALRSDKNKQKRKRTKEKEDSNEA